jgi:ABC-type glutathione transport system ATPase component
VAGTAAAATGHRAPLLTATGIRKRYRLGGLFRRGTVEAVRGAGLTVARGEVVGLVGPSGCGKSTLARCLLALERADGGEVLLGGTRFDRLRGDALRRRRREAQVIFQDARASLNPGRSARDVVCEPLDYFGIGTPAARRARAAALLERVGIPAALQGRRPGSLSSGQCQRVAIARALAPQPDLLICDEPVSALDLSVQAQVLHLLQALQGEYGFGMLFITHNLAVVEALSTRVAVMADGEIVEELEVVPGGTLAGAARHPATRALLAAVPALPGGAPPA